MLRCSGTCGSSMTELHTPAAHARGHELAAQRAVGGAGRLSATTPGSAGRPYAASVATPPSGGGAAGASPAAGVDTEGGTHGTTPGTGGAQHRHTKSVATASMSAIKTGLNDSRVSVCDDCIIPVVLSM